MAILKVLSTDTVEEAFINKYNPTSDEIIVTINRATNIITFTKEGGGTIQATLLQNKDEAISGLQISKGANNLTFDVTTGAYVIQDEQYSYVGGSIAVTPGDATNDRLDVLALDTSGVLSVITGSPAPTPTPPVVPATQLNLATVLVKANATTVSSGDVFILVNNPSTTSGTFILSESLGDVVEDAAGVNTLAALLDVDLAGLADGDRLVYNNGSGKWEVQNNTIGELDDVDLTAPATGQLLVYLSGTGFVNSNDVGRINFANKVIFKGINSPPTISVNTDDYNPANLDTTNVFRLNLTGNRNLTGIVAQEDGRIIKMFNIGGGNLTLVNQSANSAAVNRFDINSNIQLQPGQGVEIFYDNITQRWRALNR